MSLRDHLEEFLAHTEHVRNLLARGEDGYQQEFTALKTQSQRYKTEQTYSTKSGESEINIRKNRYKDILPFDYARVLLKEVDGVPGSDYINASTVKGYSGENTYIASQGPLPQTVHDFWRLIWECKATVIVMSCNEYEMGKHKCERYWVDEDETKEFNDIVVSMISQRRVHDDFLIRTLKVKKTTEERVINQFHYTAWPDHGVPNSVLPIIDMIKLIREYQPHDDVPLLIHCSAGCGRTGTICVIDYVFNQLKTEAVTADFSLYEIVQEMRKQRPAMVQTRDQYELVHRAVAAMFNKHLKDTFEDFSRVYENVHLKPPQADQPRMPPGAVIKPQSSPNQQRKRHSDNHNYVNAKPGQIDGADLVRVPTIPKNTGRHSTGTSDLDVPIYANLQEDLESELSNEAFEPNFSPKYRNSFKSNMSKFDDLEKELDITPTSPTDRTNPWSKPVPRAKPVVSPKPSNAGSPSGGKPLVGASKPTPPIKPGLGNLGERPVPRARKMKPPQPNKKTQLQIADGKTDGSVSPQANPTRSIVADIERVLTGSGQKQSSPPSRHTSVMQRRSGPFLEDSSPAKEPLQRSNSNIIHPQQSDKIKKELNLALAGKPRDFNGKEIKERRNSHQKRPSAAPPQPPPGGSKPPPPPQTAKPKPPRHDYEPVDIQPPKKETKSEDFEQNEPSRLPIQVMPVQKSNLRRFSDDSSSKELSVRKKPPMISMRSEDVNDSRAPKCLPRQPSTEYAYAQTPEQTRLRMEAMLKESNSRALNKPRTSGSAYVDVDLHSPNNDHGDLDLGHSKVGKEPPPKPGRTRLPSDAQSSTYELVSNATSGRENDSDVSSGAVGLDVGMYGQYSDVKYLADESEVGIYGIYNDDESGIYNDDESEIYNEVESFRDDNRNSHRVPPDPAPRPAADHARTESNVIVSDEEDEDGPPALPTRTPASYQLVHGDDEQPKDEPSKVEQESSASNKLKGFLKKGKDDLKMKREGLKVKTEGFKQGLLGKFGNAACRTPETSAPGGQAPPSGPPPRLSPQVNQAEIIEKTLRTLEKHPDEPVMYHNHDISFPKRVPKPKGPRQSPPWSDRAPGQMSSVQL